MDIYIGIPSYKRAKEQITLDYLERIGFPADRVVVSVQSEADRKEYEAHGIGTRAHALLYRVGNCVSDNRNTILDAFPAGTKIVFLDDDIKAIARLDGKELKAIDTAAGIIEVFEKGFALAELHGTIGFGLYPVKNAFFMRGGYRERSVVIGTVFGTKVTDIRFDREMPTKEDYDYCCKAITRYGAFIRMDEYATDAKHKTKGGCKEFWDDQSGVTAAAERLVARYPGIVALNPRRPGEVKMVKDSPARPMATANKQTTPKEAIKQNYASPRWSMEITDCSMPMSFDTYSKCSYNCLYCFSFFQKSHTTKGYVGGAVRSVNPQKG